MSWLVLAAAMVWALRRVRRLEDRVAHLETLLAATAPAETAVPPAETAVPPADTTTAEPIAAPVPTGQQRRRRRLPSLTGLEASIARRWLVWLGALALALGGLFAAGWAVSEGVIGPRARVLGAALLGFLLMAAGERARRGATAEGEGAAPDLVAPALVAGGLCALYGAALAAHLAYDLVDPVAAFLLLGLASALGAALGLRFGPLVGLLGSLGAYAAPALVHVEGGSDAAGPVFLYLAAVAPGLAALARLAGQGWVAWVSLAGAVGWQVLHILDGADPADHLPPTLHLLAFGGAGLMALLPLRGARPVRAAAWAFRLSVPAALLLLQVHLLGTHYATAPLLALAATALLAAALAWLVEPERWLAAAAAAAGLLAGTLWPRSPDLATAPARDPSIGLDPFLFLPAGAGPGVAVLAGVAVAAALLGAAGAARGRRPGFWASLAAFAPQAALALAYGRLEDQAVSPGLATVALALAAACCLAARLAPSTPALGAYAIGTVSALALGCAMALEDAWLTVALACLLAATAWAGRRLDLPAVRASTWALALAILARVLPEVDLLGDGGPAAASVPRLLYAYGVPALAFGLAARWSRRRPVDALAEFLTGGAVLFWLLLAAQLARFLAGPEGEGTPTLAEASIDSLALLGTAYALARWRRADPAALVPRHGWRPLAVLGLAGVAAGPLTSLNPLWTGAPVGDLLVADLLTPAYLLPAAVLLGLALEAERAGDRISAAVAGVAGHVLAFAWVTLEVRHAFQGAVLTGATGEAEWLAYSAAWLTWAALLLLLGVRLDRRAPRVAALAIAAAAIAKAFLLDLAELGGLYRAASFLGLGLGLVGVGWLYRRWTAATSATTPQPPPQ